MNYALHHLENHFIPKLPEIIDHHLSSHKEDYQYFLDPRFELKELLQFLAESFNPQIEPTDYQTSQLITDIYHYLTKKGIINDQLK